MTMNARLRVGRVSRIIVLASVIVALLLGIAASASGGTLDQQQTNFNGASGVFTTQSDAQTFTAGIAGDLDQADLNLLKVGTAPATVSVEIRTTSAGKPTATVLASGTIATSALGKSGAFVPVVFATPAPVAAGTQYALVVYSAGMAGNAVGWSIQGSGDPYSGGETFDSGDPLPLVPTGMDFHSRTSRSRLSSCPHPPPRPRTRRRRTRRPRTERPAQRSPGSAPRLSSGARSGGRSTAGRSSASRTARRTRGSSRSSRDRRRCFGRKAAVCFAWKAAV